MSKGDFFRYCRIVHGWLSALAFIALAFFALTGLLLNHPDWLDGSPPDPFKAQFKLAEAEIDRIENADEPILELAELAGEKADLRGDVTGGNLVRGELFVRMQGVRGLTDLRANMQTGALEIVVEPARKLSIMNELHRGERASAVWRGLIDVIAVVLLVLALVGYLIFLSMRTRLRTAIVLTAAGAAALWGVFALAVR